jgi:hypothetical protein
MKEGFRMKSTKFLGVLAALGLIVGMAGRADADTIYYNYQTTLSLASGTDALGLDGAVIDIQVDVSSSSVYINRFGYAAVVMNDDATITISGSSNASNNGTFSLPLEAFYPTFAGLFTDPGGVHEAVTLPVGGTLTILDNTIATATGAGESVGNTIQLLDFGPATSQNLQMQGSNGALYNQSSTSVTASLTPTPEPATLGLVFASFCGLGLVRRFKVR